MEIIKIAVICIVCAILARVIAPTHQDIAAVLSVSAVVVCAFYIVDSISSITTKLNLVFDTVGIETTYIASAFKALGICYVCELSASSCRDSGETALASVIDISGKVATTLICIPLLDKLMEVVRNILEM